MRFMILARSPFQSRLDGISLAPNQTRLWDCVTTRCAGGIQGPAWGIAGLGNAKVTNTVEHDLPRFPWWSRRTPRLDSLLVGPPGPHNIRL